MQHKGLLILVWVGLIFGSLPRADAISDTSMLSVLTQNFDTQTIVVQRKVLRQIGLMQLTTAPPFLIKVALSPLRYNQQVRKDALKSLIAVQADRFRPVLTIVKAESIPEKKLLEILQQVCMYTYDIEGWVRSVDFADARWMLEAKMHYIIAAIDKGARVEQAWVVGWDAEEAKKYLVEKIQADVAQVAWKTLLDFVTQ